MPPESYGRMELIRLSPATGKALNRLNVMQGQILHGKIFKMEPFSGGAQGTQAQQSGGVAKIALGSQLIEAVVNKLLPEGSSVKLEVVKLGEESFTLRLLSIDGVLTGSKNAATIPDTTDILEWTSDIKQATLPGQQFPAITSDSQQLSRIVELPRFSELPEMAATLVRNAISENFIDPVQFTAKPEVIRSTIQQAIEQLVLSVSSPQGRSIPGFSEITESIKSLVQILRPLVASLPASEIQISNSVTEIAQVLKTVSDIIRPVTEQGAVITVTGTTQQSTGTISQMQHQQASTAQQSHTQVTSEGQAQTAGTGQQSTGTQSQPSTSAPPQAQAQTGPVIQAQPVTENTPAIQQPAQAQTQGPIPVIKTEPSLIPAPTQVDIPASSPDSTRPGTSQSIRTDFMHQDISTDSAKTGHERYILLGMRTLANLADSLARVRGLSINDSANFSNHASRITTLADAFEGALIAPLLTESFHAADAIPRLLLSILFPGGSGELGIIQPDSSNPQDQSHPSHEKQENRETCIGVIRIQTENLGSLNVKLDFNRISENEGPIVSGIFSVDSTLEGQFRSEVPALDRALDARGIKSSGFTVRGLNLNQNTNSPNKTAMKKDVTGGLDLKV